MVLTTSADRKEVACKGRAAFVMRKVVKWRCEIMRLNTARNRDFCSLVWHRRFSCILELDIPFSGNVSVLPYQWDLIVHFSMSVHSRER